MSAWAWVLVGAAAWLTLSIPVGLALGTAVRRMSRLDLSELVEHEHWASLPLRRDEEAEEPRTVEPVDFTAKGSVKAIIA
jgi:hypothetical protein